MAYQNTRNYLFALGGRRFVLCVGLSIVGTFLLWFGKIDMIIWRDLVIATAAAYIVGNVGGKYVQRDSLPPSQDPGTGPIVGS